MCQLPQQPAPHLDCHIDAVLLACIPREQKSQHKPAKTHGFHVRNESSSAKTRSRRISVGHPVDHPGLLGAGGCTSRHCTSNVP